MAYEAHMLRIKDLLDENNRFLTLDKFLLKTGLKAPFTKFNGLISEFCSIFKKICVHTFVFVFVSFSPVHTTTPYPFEDAFIPSVHMLK